MCRSQLQSTSLQLKPGSFTCLGLMACRVRHEAAEALGAINTPACLQSLAQHQDDSCLEVLPSLPLATAPCRLGSSP